MMLYQSHDYATSYEIHFNRLEGENQLASKAQTTMFRMANEAIHVAGNCG